MKFSIKITLSVIALISHTALAHTITISYKDQYRAARLVAELFIKEHGIPSSLVTLQQQESPCKPLTQRLAAQLCIRGKERELILVKRDKQIIQKSYRFFLNRYE